MKLALKTQQEITKALHSTDYAEAVYRRDAQNMALVKADIQRMRRTSDWASASPSARRSALELIEQVGLERLKYDELARDRLLDKFCLTPEDVNTAASDCYKVLYSPNLILLK